MNFKFLSENSKEIKLLETKLSLIKGIGNEHLVDLMIEVYRWENDVRVTRKRWSKWQQIIVKEVAKRG